MKKYIFAFLIILSFPAYSSFGQSRHLSPYHNGLNGNGSYYSKGSTNYPSGIYYGGYFYRRRYTPTQPYIGYSPGYFYYGPSQEYWWHDRIW
jgi:hypothetical protein